MKFRIRSKSTGTFSNGHYRFGFNFTGIIKEWDTIEEVLEHIEGVAYHHFKYGWLDNFSYNGCEIVNDQGRSVLDIEQKILQDLIINTLTEEAEDV